jgi:hypothetical protein
MGRKRKFVFPARTPARQSRQTSDFRPSPRGFRPPSRRSGGGLFGSGGGLSTTMAQPFIFIGLVRGRSRASATSTSLGSPRPAGAGNRRRSPGPSAGSRWRPWREDRRGRWRRGVGGAQVVVGLLERRIDQHEGAGSGRLGHATPDHSRRRPWPRLAETAPAHRSAAPARRVQSKPVAVVGPRRRATSRGEPGIEARAALPGSARRRPAPAPRSGAAGPSACHQARDARLGLLGAQAASPLRS